jgi:SAM-dependent methyltransferase
MSTLEAVVTALRCPDCRGELLATTDDGIRCGSCSTDFPLRHGILNMLVHPSGGVVEELRGGMREAGLPQDASFEDYIFRATPHIDSFDERKQRTDKPTGPKSPDLGYYSMTERNFQHVFRRLKLTGSERVLEVGANFDFPFLTPFAERGCECFATNIFFFHTNGAEAEAPAAPDVSRVVGDMNALPYKDASFDIVVFSATLHHTPDLQETVSELARVLKPGGTALILSEPVRGLVKHLWKFVDSRFADHGRDEEIHEHEYSIFTYRSTLARNGFAINESFFSPFYEERLLSQKFDEVRFAPAARLVSFLWRNSVLRAIMKRYFLLLGQATVGLQMNVVAQKYRVEPQAGWFTRSKVQRARTENSHAGHSHAAHSHAGHSHGGEVNGQHSNGLKLAEKQHPNGQHLH